MKKKTSLWTLAGLTTAAVAFLKFSEDTPIDGVIIPPGPTEVCAYPSLSYQQLQMRLFNLDVIFEEGKVTREYYDKERAKLIYCRNLL